MSEFLRTRGFTLCKGSLENGTSDEMLQSEVGNNDNEVDNYDTVKLFQNTYSLDVYQVNLGYICDERKTSWWEGLSYHLCDKMPGL